MSKIGTVLLSTLIVWVIVCSLMPAAVHAEAPLISNVTAAVTENTAVISWLTNTNATGNVEYGPDPGPPYPNTAPFVVDTTADHTMHAVLLFGLGANSTYYYRVKSHDGNPANETTSAEYSFTTKAFTISGVTAASITTSSATITWNTNVLATSNVQYGETTGYGSVSPPDDNPDSSSHVVVLSDLLPNTTYHYRVKSKDASDNEEVSGDHEFTTEADETPPTISNVDATEADITETTAIVRWNTDEPATSQVAYSTTSHPGDYASIAEVLAAYESSSVEDTTLVTPHAVPLTGLDPDTPYFYRVLSRDVYVNEAWSDEYQFETEADETRPVISNVDAAEADITETTAIVRWNTDEPATSQVAYSTTSHPGDYAQGTTIADVLADYGSWSVEDTTKVTVHTVPLSGLDPGTEYFYRVLSKDVYVNEAWSGEYSFTTDLDITPPVISDIAFSVTTTTAIITWDTDELATGNVEYGLDDTYGWSAPVPADTLADNISHTVALSGLLPNTTYHYQVKSSDAYGNPVESVDKTFTTEADTTPPVISAVTASSITATGATITWNTNEPATSRVEYGTTSGGPYTATPEDTNLVSSHTVALSGLTPDTTYYYRVISKDGATLPNQAVSPEATFDTTADITPPVISAVTASSITDSAATITWNTNEPATSQVEYGLVSADHGSYAWTTPEDATLVGTHTVVLSGLTPNTTYYYRVISKDGADNEAWSDEAAFGTAADTVPPPAPELTWPTNGSRHADTTPAFDWEEVYDLSGVTYNLQVDDDPGFSSPVIDESGLTDSFFISPSALSAGTYYWKVRAVDGAGNLSDWTDEWQFTIDTTPPVISNVTVSDVTEDSAVISWTTDEPATSQVEYGETTEYGSASEESTTLTTEHSVTITGLEFGTEYHFRVKSTDDVGNKAVSDDYSFAPDITPPVISNVTVSDVTKDSVVISWTTDEPATSQVEYGETTEYGLVSEESTTLTTEHSVTITGLDSGTGYHFRVKSTDVAGNEAVSDDYTFTTTAVAIGWLRILLIVIGVVAVGLVVFFVVRRVFAQAGKRA